MLADIRCFAKLNLCLMSDGLVHREIQQDVDEYHSHTCRRRHMYVGEIGMNYCHMLPICLKHRSTPQESTGESPNMLMLGREVRLPVELTMPTIPVEEEAVGNRNGAQVGAGLCISLHDKKRLLSRGSVSWRQFWMPTAQTFSCTITSSW